MFMCLTLLNFPRIALWEWVYSENQILTCKKDADTEQK